MNMSLSRRQKGATSSITGESLFVFDVESPTRDIACPNTSPTPPPPFLPTPPHLPAKPEQRGQGPASYLWHVWKQHKSQAPASLDEETIKEAAAATAATAPCPILGRSYNRHAPASADAVYAMEDNQQPRRRRRPQAQKKLSRCDSGSGRGRGHWMRLKINVCRISLVFVVGALAFDLYLACLGSRAGEPSDRKGGLFFSATTAALFPSSRRTIEASRDGLFPDFPSNSDRVGSRSQHSVHLDDGQKDYTLRSIWDRGAKKGNEPPLKDNRYPQTDAKRESQPIGHGVEFKPHVGHGATAAGQAAAAADYVGVRLDELIPGENPWGAQTMPQPLQQDPFYGQRVAVVVPYVGKDLPVWWDAFAEQARLNDGLIDWIIFCDQVIPYVVTAVSPAM